MDIGVIGLGPMGSAMARSLLRAAASPAAAADNEAVITILAHDAAVEAMVNRLTAGHLNSVR